MVRLLENRLKAAFYGKKCIHHPAGLPSLRFGACKITDSPRNNATK